MGFFIVKGCDICSFFSIFVLSNLCYFLMKNSLGVVAAPHVLLILKDHIVLSKLSHQIKWNSDLDNYNETKFFGVKIPL